MHTNSSVPISFRLPAREVSEAESLAGRLGLSKAEYLRGAIEMANHYFRKEYNKKRIEAAALKVSGNVPKVFKELDNTVADNLEKYPWQE